MFIDSTHVAKTRAHADRLSILHHAAESLMGRTVCHLPPNVVDAFSRLSPSDPLRGLLDDCAALAEIERFRPPSAHRLEARECEIVAEFEETLRTDPSRPDVWLSAGLLYDSIGNKRRARQLLVRLSASRFAQRKEAQIILGRLVDRLYAVPEDSVAQSVKLSKSR